MIPSLLPKSFLALAVFVSAFSLPPSSFGQGDLTPPGAPTPTMKTLDQLDGKLDQAIAKTDQVNTKAEKRIPIDDTQTPGDADYHHIITTAGSYYLTGNLDVTRTNGIAVRAGGATVDLNGFEIRRTSGAGGHGIEVDREMDRCTILNGSISGSFATGIEFLGGSANQGRAASILRLTVTGCTVAGISAGRGSYVDGCTAHDNPGIGIEVSSGSSITKCVATGNGGNGLHAAGGSNVSHCVASENNGAAGIFVGGNSTINFCVAQSNVGSESVTAGITAGSNSRVIGCTAVANSNSGIVSAHAGMGINAGDGSAVQDCTVALNEGTGIRLTNDGIAIGNTARSNGRTEAIGAGIHALSNRNHIEGNTVLDNYRGINASGVGNLIIKNRARDNGTNHEGNYVIGADNRYGPIVDISAAGAIGASGKGPFTSTVNSVDPWANFSF